MTTMTIDEALSRAIEHHKAARLQEANELYRAILGAQPSHPIANHNLGEIALRAGRPDVAVQYLSRAVAAEPTQIAYLNTLGEALRRTGRHDEALAAFNKLVATQPNNGAAHENRGIVLSGLGRHEEAIQALGQSAALQPTRAKVWTNLANAQMADERFGQAERNYRGALKLDPTDFDASFGLAKSLVGLGRLDEAADAALQLDFAGLHAPKLAVLLAECGRPGDARRILEVELARDPADSAGCRSVMAALGFDDPPDRASEAQIQRLYAERAAFWNSGSRDYRAADLVAQAIVSRVSAAYILDAGCGTGLSGPLLRPAAKRLEGVDLSAPMLAQAATKGVYDQLWQAELVAFLEQRASAYDAIACAATLVHFGNLARPLAAVAGALRAGGLFAATLFPAADPEAFGIHADSAMAQGGIFMHGETYVRREAQVAGLRIEGLTRETHEHRLGKQVVGLLAVIKRP